MNGKGEGRRREGGDCFCIDEIWDMRTRRGQEERIVMHRRIAVLTSPAQLLSSYTQAARRGVQAMSRRTGTEGMPLQIPLLQDQC